MFSGRFSRRASDALEQHSGLLCVDMDNCAAPAQLREKLAADKHVVSAFVSPTGSGAKVVVRVRTDASTHEANFAAAKQHFGGTFGVSVDEACRTSAALLCLTTRTHSSGKGR
jgi:hypothetical protein